MSKVARLLLIDDDRSLLELLSGFLAPQEGGSGDHENDTALHWDVHGGRIVKRFLKCVRGKQVRRHIG